MNNCDLHYFDFCLLCGSFRSRCCKRAISVNTSSGLVSISRSASARSLSSSNTTNTITLSKALLGINLNATYNGTTNYASLVQTNGLVGGDTVTGVVINDPNVAANPTNYITAVTGTLGSGGSGYNLLQNYTISGSASGIATTGAPATNTTNTVTLNSIPNTVFYQVIPDAYFAYQPISVFLLASIVADNSDGDDDQSQEGTMIGNSRHLSYDGSAILKMGITVGKIYDGLNPIEIPLDEDIYDFALPTKPLFPIKNSSSNI